MIDSALPTKSLIGTLIILITFVISTIILLATLNDPYAKWFLLPLVMGLAISMIKCISNMQEYVNLLTDISNSTTREVILETCPEYWIKDTAFVEQEGDKANPIQTTICRNYKTDEDGKTVYVGGSGKGGKDSTFVKNFGNPDQTFEDTLDAMNNTLIEKEGQQTSETFVTHTVDDGVANVNQAIANGDGGIYKTDNPTYPNNYTTFVDRTRASGATPWESDSKNTNEIGGSHYHHEGALIHHVNSNSSHKDLNGAIWHSHDNDLQMDASSIVNSDITDKWIFSRNSQIKGVELNLDKLNTASNVCDLAKNFYWTEASNKCSFGQASSQ